MAGDPGFEPGNDGVKVRCLTAWLIPNNMKWGDRWDSNPRMPEPQSGALTTSPRSPQVRHINFYGMAGAAGIEPTLTVLETAVLPLNYAPKTKGKVKWWRLMDSNHRTRKGRDLQSPAFGHFANPPRLHNWCRREDLNPQPTDYKSVALPIELQRHDCHDENGGLGRNRTADTWIFSPLLYRLSYQAV